MNYIEEVEKFHKLFNHPVLQMPQIPDAKRCALRVSLIAEELKELQEAIENNDIVEAADALADLQYVLSGAILEFGLGSKFDEVFAEVQRSNMSKACITKKDELMTIEHYNEQGQEAYSVRKDLFDDDGGYIGQGFLVYRKADNKLLKSIAYSPANIADIVNK